MSRNSAAITYVISIVKFVVIGLFKIFSTSTRELVWILPNWHVRNIFKNGYSTLKLLKKLKRYTSYQTRKHLVESLILAKIDYFNVFFKGLPKYQIQRVNKLIQACAGFVKYKYGELKDIADLNWLLIEERIDFALMKLVFNGLNNKNMPENLQLKLSKEKLSLRKNSVMLEHQNENIKPAYLEEANKVFSGLPNEIREDICAISFSMFKNKLKNYLFDKTIPKILSCC